MKYLSKEALEDIANSLLENPTPKTLGELNQKYNQEETVSLSKEVVGQAPPSMEIPPISMGEPSVKPIPSFDIPKIDVPNLNNNNNDSINPSVISQPSLNNNISSNNNVPLANSEVPFNGNIFEPISNNPSSMMQTTDNFGISENPKNEIPVTSNTFFGPSVPSGGNPIPISGQNMQTPNVGPTMFGQIQNDFQRAA